MAKAKRVKGIKCNAAAPEGIKLVLLKRFEELSDLRDAALDWSEPEGVHSMRVASRRLRSALRDFMPYLRKRGITSVQKQLRALAAVLGEVRDQDVAIMALEKLESNAPDHVSPTLKEFISKRKEEREQAREELTAALEKDQLKEFEAQFVVGVEKSTTINEAKNQSATPASPVTFLKMSRRVIIERLRELEKLSTDMFNPFEVETLHEMRIAAKRLRYAVELFQQCWGRSIGSHAKRAARIQSALGDVHDCDVWIESFSRQIREARRNKDHERVAAYVWLLNHFIKLRTKHLRQAFARWREWEAQDVSAKLRALLDTESLGRTRGRNQDLAPSEEARVD